MTYNNFYLTDFMAGDRPTANEVVDFAWSVRRDLSMDGHIDDTLDIGLDNAKNRAGVFRPKRMVITISRFFIEHATVEAIQETVLHEFAHACDYHERGTSDHGDNWKSWCRELGMKSTDRCFDPATDAPDMPKGKYRADCETCDKQGLNWKWKMSAAMRQGRFYCRKCRSKVVWTDIEAAA